MDSTKKPWESKTVILNGVLGIVAAIAIFFPGASAISAFISAHSSEIGVVWSMLNIALRAVSKDAISLTD